MIFPVPLQENYYEGVYTLQQTYLLDDLYNFYIQTKEGSLDLVVREDASLEPEEYQIRIDAAGILIRYSTEQGKFRALTSLRQLMQQNSEALPYVEILDKPQFANRGFLWEISSGRMPKVPHILRIVDYLAGLKYNEFQIYMENFCYKYPAFPDLTADYDCLTPEDILVIDRYCQERFIDLIPCQNGFGHMAAWLKEERWQHLEVTDGVEHGGTLNPLLPESFELMDEIYGSLLPYFSSEKVNICLDEAFMLGKFQLEEACRKYGNDNVFMDWLNRLTDLACGKYGKKTVQFWGDMIVDYPESFHRVPKNAVAMEWDYDLIQSQLMEGRCMALAEKGIPFYVCPSTNTYSTFTGRFDVTSFNIRTAAEVGRKHGAKGFMLTEWGNDGTPNFFVWSYVPVALGGQYSWNVGVKQHGGWLKPEFIHMAEKYADAQVFRAPVSRKLYRIANYYLLEPERIHGQTMCHQIMKNPLQKMDFDSFFRLEEVGEPFCFRNVIRYVQEMIREIEDLDLAEYYRRRIIINAKQVILAAEYALVKLAGEVTREKYEELCGLNRWIAAEFRELWMEENYEKGIEEVEGYLDERYQELAVFKSSDTPFA